MPSETRERPVERGPTERGGARAMAAVVAGLALATGLAYGRVLDAPFVFDDLRNVSGNAALRTDAPSLAALWRAAFESPTPRPTAYASFAANLWWTGPEPRGFRVTNLAIHVASGLLVFVLAGQLYRRAARLRGVAPALADPRVRTRLAALAAGLFVAHPLGIQAVTYVVQRMTSLATALGVAALVVWLRADAVRHPTRRLAVRAVALSLLALACGAKEIALVIPLGLWWIRACFERDFDAGWLRRTGIPLVLVGALGAVSVVVQGSLLADYAAQPFTLGERLLSAPRVLGHYLGWVVLPLPSRLSVVHDLAPSRGLLDPWTTGPAWLALASVAIGALALARRERFATFAVGWALLFLALETTLPPLALAFEHRLYLPLVGVAVALPACAVGRLGTARTLALGALLVGAGLAATGLRNEAWRDPVTLWSDAAHKNPNSAQAHDEWGLALLNAARPGEARDVLERAAALDPGRAETALHQGVVLGHLGERDASLDALRRAVRLDPSYPRAHAQLGRRLAADGDPEAMRVLARAVALAPRDPGMRHALADWLARQGRGAEARDEWETALASDPGHAPSHTGLATLALAARDEPAARHHFEKALDRDPDSPVARNNLAWLLATSQSPNVRDPERALALVATLRDAPDLSAEILDTIARVLAENGERTEARRVAGEAAARAEAEDRPALAREIRERARAYAPADE